MAANLIFEYADKIVPMFFSECGFKVYNVFAGQLKWYLTKVL